MLPLIHLGPNWYFPTYFLWISFTYSICLFFVAYRASSLEVSRSLALDLSFAAMVGGFLGARLFHVFYEEWPYYRRHPIVIFEFWHGGFVFYGGFIGAILACLLVLRLKREKFWFWADFFAPILSLGYAVGRIGCFLDGCCYGRYCPYPWAIEFHHPWLPQGPRHPTQLYASFWGFAVFSLLMRFESKIRARARDYNGYLFSVWLTLHAAGRIFMEYFRADDRGAFIFGMSISTFISLLLIAIAVANLVRLERLAHTA